MALALIGTVLTAGSAIIGGIDKANALNYQAQVATNNALIEKQNAAYAASAGAAQTEQSGLQEREKGARLRAGIAANGLDVNTGSAVDLQESQREIGNLDTRTVSNNAAMQTYGYQVKSTADTAQAGLDKAEASNAVTEGIVKGAGTLFGSPSFDSLLGGGSGGGGGGGGPSVPSNYQWMQPASSTDSSLATG